MTVGVGLAAGLATAAGDAIQGTLFGVTGRDPITYITVVVLVTVVSLIATLVPARRATRVDPMIALRAD
jgi:putative ABC transport system permease protein